MGEPWFTGLDKQRALMVCRACGAVFATGIAYLFATCPVCGHSGQPLALPPTQAKEE